MDTDSFKPTNHISPRNRTLEAIMWKQLFLLALLVVPCLPRDAAAQPVVKIQGAVTYQYLGLGMVNVNPVTGQMPFPVDTKMELGNRAMSCG